MVDGILHVTDPFPTCAVPASRPGPRRGRANARTRPGACLSTLRCLAALVLGLAAESIARPLAWDAERMLAAAAAHGPRAAATVRELQLSLTRLLDADDATRLAAVNQFFNRRIVFMEDSQNWKQADYWASPVELLARGAGDCEDYVIAKYFSLLVAGMPAVRLRLVYVRLQVGGPQGAVLPHMVLAYYASPNAEPAILDNLVNDIKPASRRPDLVPVFSFNGDSVWHGVDGPPVADSIARLSRWREVLAKAKAEGFQ
jgi:predicted transglutaminase-like cysteine proteinase